LDNQENEMRTAVRLRTLTAEEVTEVWRLANSRKEAARLVQGARLITCLLDDPNLYAGDVGLKAGFRLAFVGAG
jgi:hypothetical protein